MPPGVTPLRAPAMGAAGLPNVTLLDVSPPYAATPTTSTPFACSAFLIAISLSVKGVEWGGGVGLGFE